MGRQDSAAETVCEATGDPHRHEFSVEEADDFEREVAILGGSHRFMQLLEERFQERTTISLDEFTTTLSSRQVDCRSS
jgi:hypothetical protein